MRTREYSFHLRLSRKEYELLMRNSEKAGLTPQNYLLELVNGGTPKELPQLEFDDILKNLRQINNNLNQIAMKANASGFIDARSYRENYSRLQEQVGEIIRGIY